MKKIRSVIAVMLSALTLAASFTPYSAHAAPQCAKFTIIVQPGIIVMKNGAILTPGVEVGFTNGDVCRAFLLSGCVDGFPVYVGMLKGYIWKVDHWVFKNAFTINLWQHTSDETLVLHGAAAPDCSDATVNGEYVYANQCGTGQ